MSTRIFPARHMYGWSAMISQQKDLHNNGLYFAIVNFQIRMVSMVKQPTHSTETTFELAKYSHKIEEACLTT